MLPLVNAYSSIRAAPTVFKCVWPLVGATLDQPGTAMQIRPWPGAHACTVSSRIGAVCVRGFVFLGVCWLFQVGAGLSSVSMPPWMNDCSSKRGTPTVFKSVLHISDATLDPLGTAMQTRPRPGAQACTVSTWSGAVCVRVVLCFLECVACFRLVQVCPVLACYL